MARYYRLGESNEPIPSDGGAVASEIGKHVALTKLSDGTTVSTVFLGINHGYGDGPPVLWETMVFWGDGHPVDTEIQERYTSHADALAGHHDLVRRLTPTVQTEE